MKDEPAATLDVITRGQNKDMDSQFNNPQAAEPEATTRDEDASWVVRCRSSDLI